ncbi:MAG TPA: hypothetical protein VMV43_02750, partial [Candidatus Nanopelagicaceae bacterium]|nr:hypothetical protein [Candidatus Nanopelagicaceae bacterium]
MEYSEWLTMKALEYRNDVLYFAGKNTLEISKEFGTPIYVINESSIRERYRNLKDLLNSEYKNNRIHYAVKANSNLSILKIFHSEGAFFDCTSM